MKSRRINSLLVLLLVTASMLAGGAAQALPIQRTITFDTSGAGADLDDWFLPVSIPANPNQFGVDLLSGAGDLDTPIAAVGRDLKTFTYTWDNNNLYLYVERFASSTNANDWWFYMDTSADGLLQTGEYVLRVKWTGSNGRTTRSLFTYNESAVGGDPLVGPPGGVGDGYDMPGTVTPLTTYPLIYGGATAGSYPSLAGVAMETFVAWTAIGKTGPGSLGFHVASSNGTNIPTQLDDNMDGPNGNSLVFFTDLEVTKTADVTTAIGNDLFTYTVTITNTGSFPSVDVSLDDVLPAGITYVSDDSLSTGTTYDSGTGLWTIGTIAAGTNISLAITVRADILGATTIVTNTANNLDSASVDLDPDNNVGSVDVIINPTPDLTVNKTHGGDFTAGINGTWTISVSNVGFGDETGTITVTDTLDANFTYVSGTGSGWSCGAVGQLVTCTHAGTLAAGGVLPNLFLTALPAVAGVFPNSASVSGPTYDDVPGNNTSPADSTTVNAAGAQSCFAVADTGDILTLIDTSITNPPTENETGIGPTTGATNIEAIAYECSTGTLYAANAGILGTLNTTTGTFTAIGAVGAGGDIDGLAYDAVTGALYGVVNLGGVDALIQINKTTGAFVPNAFGFGVDSVPVGSTNLVTDIAVDVTGQMYGIDADFSPDRLMTIDKSSGATVAFAANLGVDDILGLGRDALGNLWATQGSQVIHQVNKVTGASIGTNVIDNGNDYDAIDCSANCIAATADLTVTKTVSDSTPRIGDTITFTITVSNVGPDAATAVQLIDNIESGLAYASDIPSQGTYDEPSDLWFIGTITAGGSATLTIDVIVGGTVGVTVNNTATISYVTQDESDTSDNSDSVTVTPVVSDLSTSTKSVADLNGGDVEPGDTLRYTITLTETAGAAITGVQVTDDIPANVSGFTVLTTPAGSTDSSVIGGGANSTGFLDINNITVGALSSETIIFEVIIDAGALVGDTFDNSATIIYSDGADVTPSAPTMTVSNTPQVKELYLDTPTTDLSRTPSTSTTVATLTKSNPVTWTMTPVSQTNMTLAAGNIPIALWLEGVGGGATRDVTVSLDYTGTSSGNIGSQSVIIPNTIGLRTFSISLGSDLTLLAGTSITLTITNTTTGGSSDVEMTPLNAGINSRVDLNMLTIINVDSVQFFDGACPAPPTLPAGPPVTNFLPNESLCVQALISDPFGSFDITDALITIVDADTVTQVSSTSMTEQVDSGTSTKTYLYDYTIPASPATGTWTASVTAEEGTENAVTDTGAASFTITLPPLITIMKSANVGNAAPNDIITYSLTLVNTGLGTATSVLLTDDLSPYGELSIDAYGSNTPFQFTDGGTASGLTLGTPEYSINGGPFSTTTPAGPFNGTVTDWQIPMTGTMNNSGASFTINYQIRVE